MNILFYILATILFICFAVKSWIAYKEKNEKIALAELIGSVIASIMWIVWVWKMLKICLLSNPVFQLKMKLQVKDN